jgi:hypothetical protein
MRNTESRESLQRKLAFFWRDTVERENQEPTHISALADVEALLWMHLGIELDLFHKEDVESRVEEHRFRLQGACVRTRKLNGSRFFPLHFIEEFEEGKAIGEIRYGDKINPELFEHAVLELLFTEIGKFAASRENSTFTYLITFAEEGEWDEALDNADPKRLIARKLSTKADEALAGMFSILEHMQALREILEAEADSQYAINALKKRLRTIHNWRTNLVDSKVKMRFEQLTANLIRNLKADKELAELKFDANEVVSRINMLCQSWLGTEDFVIDIDRAAA